MKRNMNQFASKLRNNLPKSEQWFWDNYKKTNLYDENDLSNQVFGRRIPDVINHIYKFIVEIDGSIHDDPKIQQRDNDKTKNWNKRGYMVIRIKAYDKKELNYAFSTIRIRKKIIKKFYVFNVQ